MKKSNTHTLSDCSSTEVENKVQLTIYGLFSLERNKR